MVIEGGDEDGKAGARVWTAVESWWP